MGLPRDTTILIVDDDDVDRMALRRGFRHVSGIFSVAEARNGLEALQMLRGEHPVRNVSEPRLVLLDLNMPKMNGFEFLEALRADPRLTDTPVFVLTTSNAPTDMLEARRYGVSGYLVKTGAGDEFPLVLEMLNRYWRESGAAPLVSAPPRARDTVSTPLHSRPPRAPRIEPAASASRPGDALRILLIEDDLVDRRNFERLLRQTDIEAELVEACDGETGLEAFSTQRFDLVFLDYRLPDLDGVHLLQQLLARDPLVTVVALTGQGQRELAALMISTGAVDYLEKGRLDEEILARTIDFARVRRRAEAKFRLLVAKHHAPIVVLAEGGLVRFANPAALDFFGWTREPRDVVLNLPPEGDLLEWTQRADGVRWAEIHVQEMEWEGLPCRLVSLRDFTALRRANESLEEAVRRLEQTNARLDKFASTLSHDLREPLRAINSFSKILAERYLSDDDDEGRELFDFVIDGGARLTQMITTVLEYARSGATPLRLQRTDSHAIATDVLYELGPLIDETSASVELGTLPIVDADSTALTRILQNLIANAIKYRGQEPPVIRVDASEDDEHTVTFSVADNGRGIAAEHIDSIFDSFFRLEQSGDVRGTGLGLDICRTLVELHGGTISVSSEEGIGSTFRFTIPSQSVSEPKPIQAC